MLPIILIKKNVCSYFNTLRVYVVNNNFYRCCNANLYADQWCGEDNFLRPVPQHKWVGGGVY